jgi:hypothetical protein
MTRLVEFPLESGGVAVVQVAEGMGGTGGTGGTDDLPVARDRPVTRGMRDGAVAERAQQTFEQAVDRVQPATEALIARFRSMTRPPDEVSISFGLAVTAEAGAVITAAGASANFSVSMTWRAPPRSEPPDGAGRSEPPDGAGDSEPPDGAG